MKKIVVLDGHTLNPGDLSWEPLRALGDVAVYDRTPTELVFERMKDCDYVFTNKTGIDKSLIDRCPKLSFIGVLATGYNVVDIEAARDKGIPVCNVPTYGTDAVAQFTFALILALCHRVEAHSKSVFEGQWQSSPDFCYWSHPLIELAGKTIGLVGLGRIGSRTAEIAKAFGMNVIAYARSKNPGEEAGGVKFVTLDDLYGQADIISLHVPLSEETKAMIGTEAIRKMKDGVMIVNTSRGPLIDELALHDALVSGKIKSAALDVVSKEPIEADNILLNAPNLILTPHIAWAPLEARQRLLDIAVENLRHAMAGTPINVVN